MIRMLSFLRKMFTAVGVAAAAIVPAHGAGVIPFALTQQIDANGLPLAGCKLNIYQVGTTATLQQIFQDFGLSITLPNPLTCDQTGRLPMFYLADGQVHVNLTDAGGTVLVDVPVMQVVGPSTGGGGGGTVDPNSIASTGDIKFRQTSEILAGWVKLNAQTIGSATSGATGRANNDTQALYVYLWNNCPNAHCAVSTGRGANGLNDFNANKTLTLPDWRSRQPLGRDTMDASLAAGRLLAANVTSGGGDGVDTPGAWGGESNHVQLLTELVQHNHGVNDPTHAHGITDPTHTHTVSDPTHAHSYIDPTHAHNYDIIGGPAIFGSGSSFGTPQGAANAGTTTSNATGITINPAATNISILARATGVTVNAAATGVSIQNAGSSNAMPVVDPFILGTWYMRL